MVVFFFSYNLLLFNISVISLIKALSCLYAACSSAVVCYIFQASAFYPRPSLAILRTGAIWLSLSSFAFLLPWNETQSLSIFFLSRLPSKWWPERQVGIMYLADAFIHSTIEGTLFKVCVQQQWNKMKTILLYYKPASSYFLKWFETILDIYIPTVWCL